MILISFGSKLKKDKIWDKHNKTTIKKVITYLEEVAKNGLKRESSSSWIEPRGSCQKKAIICKRKWMAWKEDTRAEQADVGGAETNTITNLPEEGALISKFPNWH